MKKPNKPEPSERSLAATIAGVEEWIQNQCKSDEDFLFDGYRFYTLNQFAELAIKEIKAGTPLGKELICAILKTREDEKAGRPFKYHIHAVLSRNSAQEAMREPTEDAVDTPLEEISKKTSAAARLTTSEGRTVAKKRKKKKT